MKKSELQERILMERLAESQKISKAEATQLLGVSESTVRRLFIRLEESGQVVRNHGGIQVVPGNFLNCAAILPDAQKPEEESLAGIACDQVAPGDVLFIGSGGLPVQVGARLAQKMEGGHLSNITVFTNSLPVLRYLHSHTAVNLLGGEYCDQRQDFSGYLTEEILKNLYFSKCLLDTDGYDPESGFTCRDFSAARMKQTVLEHSQKTYILMGHGQFRPGALVGFAHQCRVDAVLVNEMPDAAAATKLREQGTEIITGRYFE